MAVARNRRIAPVPSNLFPPFRRERSSALAGTGGRVYLCCGFFAGDNTIMLDAAIKALSQIVSPPMRSILWRSIGLALALIVVLAIGLQRLLSWLATSGM